MLVISSDKDGRETEKNAARKEEAIQAGVPSLAMWKMTQNYNEVTNIKDMNRVIVSDFYFVAIQIHSMMYCKGQRQYGLAYSFMHRRPNFNSKLHRNSGKMANAIHRR